MSFRRLPWPVLYLVRCAIVMVTGMVVGLHLFGEFWGLRWRVGTYRLDLDVYRLSGLVWLHGGQLYDTLSWTSAGTPMLFTYPPFAAVLFSPLAVARLAVDGAVFTVISIALTGVVIAVTLYEDVPPVVDFRWRSWSSLGGDHGFIVLDGVAGFGGDMLVESAPERGQV